MDLVKMITSVEFSETRRGLDRDEVRAFLQEVAAAVASLERAHTDARSRAERAEARAVEAMDGPTIQRTLILAQRTADAAIAEAETAARQIVMDAEQMATGRIKEAEAHADRTRVAAEESASMTIQTANQRAHQLIVEAKAEATRASDELRARLRREIADLGQTREVLSRDVTIFESHMGEQRKRIEAALGALQMLVEHPDALRKMAVPAMASVTIPDVVVIDEAEPRWSPAMARAEAMESIDAMRDADHTRAMDPARSWTAGESMTVGRASARRDDMANAAHSTDGSPTSEIAAGEMTPDEMPTREMPGHDLGRGMRIIDLAQADRDLNEADTNELAREALQSMFPGEERWSPRRSPDRRR